MLRIQDAKYMKVGSKDKISQYVDFTYGYGSDATLGFNQQRDTSFPITLIPRSIDEFVTQKYKIIFVLQKNSDIIKPDVTLYEEMLPDDAWNKSMAAVQQADVLIIAGTSLMVYPAAYIVEYFRGKHLIIINRDATPRDSKAELVIHDSFGEVMAQVVASL